MPGYPPEYLRYAYSILAASKTIEDFATLEPASPADPGMLKIEDFDAGETYYADACPAKLQPSPILHYLTPSGLSASQSGQKWLWSLRKPINKAFERMCKGYSMFSEILAKLTDYFDENGYDDNESAYDAFMRQCSYHREAGKWADGGNSMQSLDLWAAFRNEMIYCDIRVLFAGDAICRIGGKDSFFDDARGCIHLEKLIHSISVKPIISIGKDGIKAEFRINAALKGSLPEPRHMLSEVETWNELF